MPKELNFEEFEQELEEIFSPEQREWLARLLHDHVSGLVTNIAMQVEIVNKMFARNMDVEQISNEATSLKENVSSASKHIVAIEKTIRPKKPDAEG
jgi:glucose-6-phosphate-specific signal transduction histidine kinase